MDEGVYCIKFLFTYGVLERSVKMLSLDDFEEIEDPPTDLSHKDRQGELKRVLRFLKFLILPDMYKRIHEYQSPYTRVDLYKLRRTAYEIEDMLIVAATEQLGQKIKGKPVHMLLPLDYHVTDPTIMLLKLEQMLCYTLADSDSNRDTDFGTDSETESRCSSLSYIISDYEAGCAEGIEDEWSFAPPALSSRYDQMWFREDTIVGRESEKKQILDWIFNPDGHPNVICVYGGAGMGKTSLAKMICNDVKVSTRFDLVLFGLPPRTTDLKSRIVEIIRSFTNQSWSYLHRMNMETLKGRLRRILSAQKYLLVLDDYDEFGKIAEWKEFRQILEVGSAGSTVIVMGWVFPARCLKLKYLAENDCWSLFTRCAGFDQQAEQEYPTLRDIGRSLVKQCRGCPQAVKILGSMLHTNRDERSWMQIKERKIWTIAQYRQNAGHPVFTINLEYMSSDLLQCLFILSILSENNFISRDHLTFSWMALGLLQSRNGNEDPKDIGDTYFNELLIRSAIQSFWSDGHHMVLMHNYAVVLLYRMYVREVALLTDDAPFLEGCSHIIWKVDQSSLDKGFAPNHLTLPRVRTFMFHKYLGPVSRLFLEEVISKLRLARVLLLDGTEFEELPETIGNSKLLRYLSLAGNHKLKLLPKSMCQLLNLQTLDLSGCEQLQTLPIYMHNLRHLLLSMSLEKVPEEALKSWTSLHHLKLCNCPYLRSISEGIEHLQALRVLQIHDCPLISSLPNNIKHLTYLKELSIRNCQVLDLTQWDGFSGLRGLQYLQFQGLPKLSKFPQGLQFPADKLRHFVVSNCENLTALPECLDGFRNLLEMVIENCPNIVSLPKGIHGITTLQLLKIVNCPKLTKMSESGMGEDWHLRSHIPKIQEQHQAIQTLKEHSGVSASTIAPTKSSGTSYQEAPSKMKQTVMKVDISSDKSTTQKLLKAVAKIRGVNSIEFDHKKGVLTVVGVVEPVSIYKVLKKIKIKSEILSVGPAKPRGLTHEMGLNKQEPDVKEYKNPIAGAHFQKDEDLLPQVSMVEGEMKDLCFILILLPENYEIEKDTLIQLWIAGEYIKGEPMELKGEMYFRSVLDNGYLLRSRTDFMTGKDRYRKNTKKINELLDSQNDNSSSYLKWDNEYQNNSKSDVELIQHVSLVCSDIDGTVFQTLQQTQQFSKLRTLLFLGNHAHKVKRVPDMLFLGFENLQALDLSRTLIRELPSSIGHNVHLRYLDLSWTLIEWLPDIICSLLELQTLKLKGCSKLSVLPEQFQKLTKLRHLDVDVLRQFETMPKGIGSLVNLQTLSAFLVGTEDGCKIEELKELNKLAGNFCIAKLEHVENINEAREAALYKKGHLEKLELRWTASELWGTHHNSDAILECLQPSTRLEELQIFCYEGSQFPSWISNPEFNNLVRVVFYRCENVLELPLIEQLPLLKRLELVRMNSVVKIERRGNPKKDVAFPKLEELEINEMQNLIVWDWKKRNESDFVSLTRLIINDCPELQEFDVLPHLSSIRYFEIRESSELQSLSDMKLPDSLEELIVEDCPQITNKCLELEGVDWYKMKHVPTKSIH